MRLITTAATTALLLALTACGSDDTDDSNEDAGGFNTDDVPACSDVWKVGETFPAEGYEGCMEGDELQVAVFQGDCEVATHQDRLWATPGGTIAEIEGDPAYDKAFAGECP